MSLTFRIFRMAMLVFLAALMSCATKLPPEEIPELYWPLPPQRPRVKFVDYIIGSLDVTGSRRGEVKRALFGEEGEVGFIKPVFIASGKGVVYVTDLTGVLALDFKGNKFNLIGRGKFINPTGVAVSERDILFVADSAHKKIFRLDLKAGNIESISEEKFGNPGGLAVDDVNGRLIAVDVKKHLVNVYTLDGEFLFSFGSRGVEEGEFNFPYDAVTDSEGNIYVVDSGNFRVQKFDKDGNFLMAFGSVGTLPGQFARPKGIALDSDENIYVVDGAFSNFQIFDKEGRSLLAVGSVGIEPGQFVLPIGITINEQDEVFVVDQLNKRLQKFQYITYEDER
jgi:DNA-binding beta-propeller fold protein YncE